MMDVDPRSLDELACRRPWQAPGFQFALFDRQVWHLAMPRVVVETHLGPAGPVPIPRFTLEHGPEDTGPWLDDAYERAFHVARQAPEGLDEGERHRRFIVPAAMPMLMKNYAITDEEAEWLLTPRPAPYPGIDRMDAGLMRSLDRVLIRALGCVAYDLPALQMVATMKTLPYRIAAGWLVIDTLSN